MMIGKFNLGNFYQSDEWVNLMKVIKDERTNDEGQIICEHCGKPIVRAYDCIGHHVNELTEENVNDVLISLNPCNVQLVHHRCHNIIHDRLGLSREKQVFLVYGAPLAGKHEWVETVKSDGDLIIDIDSIWQCVSGCNRYTKPNRLRAIVFKMRDELIDCVRYRRGNWLNAYIVGGYPLISERQRLCKMLGAREVFVERSIDECMDRLDKLDEIKDKNEWLKYIAEWFDRYSGPLG